MIAANNTVNIAWEIPPAAAGDAPIRDKLPRVNSRKPRLKYVGFL